MKRILIILLFATMQSSAQTWTEISNILNSKPAPLSSTSVSANNTSLAGTFNLMTTGYRAISFSLSGTWSAGVQLQGSNDSSVGWNKIQCATSTSFATSWLDTITTNGSYSALTTGFKYIRLRTITYSSGTIVPVVIGYLGNINLPPPPTTVSIGAVSVTGGLDADDSLALKNISTYQQDGTQKTQLTDPIGQDLIFSLLAPGEYAIPVTLYNASSGTAFAPPVQYEESSTWGITALTGNLMVGKHGDTIRSLKLDRNSNLKVGLGTIDSTALGEINTKLGGTLTVSSHAVTNAGTFVVQENGAALTALQLIDDAVNTTASAISSRGIGVQGTDGTNARILKTDASGELQVDVLTIPAIPAGTNNIGDVDVLTLPALPAGSNNIGDVDVLSLPALPAGNNNIGDVDIASGTITANQGGTWNINNLSGTVSLPTGASTETTLSTLNSKVPSGLTVNANRLAIYSPDSIRIHSVGTIPVSIAGSFTTSLDAVDSANLALLADARLQANTTGADRPGFGAFGLMETTPSSVTNGYVYPLSLNPRRELRVAIGAAGDVSTYTPGRTVGTESYWSFDTLGRARTVDTVAGNLLSSINSKIRDTLGGQILVHDSLMDYWFSTIQPDINGLYGEAQTQTLYMVDSMSVHHQQIEDSLGRIFEELQSIENQIINRVPNNLTVNSNRLAIYSPDSLRIHVSSPLSTRLWSVDSTNLAGINTKLAGTLTVGSHAVTNAGTFAVQVDEFTAASLPLPTGASTEATLSSLLSRVPSGLTVNSNRLAIYSPDSLKIYSVGTIPVSFGALPAGTNNIGDVDVLSMPTTNVQGTAAHDAALSGNPLNLGAKGVSAEPTAITADRQVQLIADLAGKLINSPYANSENFISGSTSAITDTTSTSVMAAAGSGVRNYITTILITNSHATVSTFVKILDGTTTLWQGYALAAGGGFSVTFPVPLRGTANTAINAKCVTTGANVVVNCAGYKGR